MPAEYVNLILCRDVYHCDPDTLANLDAEQVNLHLTLLDVESKVAQRRKNSGDVDGL